MDDDSADDHHRLLIGTRNITRFRAGQTVFESGDESFGAMVIRFGSIRVSEELRVEGSRPVQITAAGLWIVGLLGAMKNERRRSTAVAQECTLATFVSRNEIGQLFAALPGLAQNIELKYHSGTATSIGYRLDAIPLPIDPTDAPTRASAGWGRVRRSDHSLRLVGRPIPDSGDGLGDPENRVR